MVLDEGCKIKFRWISFLRRGLLTSTSDCHSRFSKMRRRDLNRFSLYRSLTNYLLRLLEWWLSTSFSKHGWLFSEVSCLIHWSFLAATSSSASPALSNLSWPKHSTLAFWAWSCLFLDYLFICSFMLASQSIFVLLFFGLKCTFLVLKLFSWEHWFTYLFEFFLVLRLNCLLWWNECDLRVC